MNREEAKEILTHNWTRVDNPNYSESELDEAFFMAIEALSAEAVQGWIPLSHDDDGLGTDFPYERDGEWVIVTDGKTISVERIKKDAYDHFFPDGRWFELEDVIAWMPLPKLYREDGE